MIAGRFRFVVASAPIFGFAGATASGENGVSEDEVVFGQLTALDGLARALGQG